MIVIPASLRSDFIHIAGMTILIALESTFHIAGIRSRLARVRTKGVDPAHFIAVSEQTWCWPAASENAANPRNRLPDHFIPNPMARRTAR